MGDTVLKINVVGFNLFVILIMLVNFDTVVSIKKCLDCHLIIILHYCCIFIYIKYYFSSNNFVL
jgi:hypothetical protein